MEMGLRKCLLYLAVFAPLIESVLGNVNDVPEPNTEAEHIQLQLWSNFSRKCDTGFSDTRKDSKRAWCFRRPGHNGCHLLTPKHNVLKNVTVTQDGKWQHLSISSAQFDHIGRYTCGDDQYFFLYVTELVDTVIIPYNGNKSFACPEAQATWNLKGPSGKLLPVSAEKTANVWQDNDIDSSELFVTQVRQRKTYICSRLHFDHNSIFRTVNIEISPTIISTPRNTTAREQTTVALECVAAADRTPTITWHRDGCEIASKTSSSPPRFSFNNGNLIIYDCRTSDTGFYTCQAETTRGVARATAFLKVQGSPCEDMIDDCLSYVHVCQDATFGHYMRKNCKKSCSYC